MLKEQDIKQLKQQINESVEGFTTAMKQKLYKNIHKGIWTECSLDYLVNRLDEEVRELNDPIDQLDGSDESVFGVIDECVDVANFVMMIADVLGRELRKL